MKSKLFRAGALLMATVLLFSLSACGAGEGGETAETTTTTAATTPTTTAPIRYQNLLTGEQNLEVNNNRPVAFMIGNSGYYGDILQKNIDKADLFVEAETEAGIPRIMAVFGSIDNVPSEVGPVRSARTHFVKMAKALDVIYCHIGGSVKAKELIPSLGITDMDGIGGNFVKVNNDLKAANKAVEHTKVFVRENLVKNINSRGVRTTTSYKAPYAFGTKAGTGKGASVQLNISAGKKVAFSYNASTGLYTKHRTTLSSNVHKTIDGNAISVKNVIIMYDQRYTEDYQGGKEWHCSFKLNSGSGMLLTNGKSRSIRWTRTDSGLSFTESDGTPLTVAKGKTYICLTDKTLAAKTVLK